MNVTHWQKVDSANPFDRGTFTFDREKVDSADHHEPQPKFPYK